MSSRTRTRPPAPPQSQGAGGAAAGGERMGTAQIAGSLYVSRATVRTHIQKVITKIELHSRVEVAAFVTQHQVLQNLDWML
jgi:hypothetical protein